MFKKIDIDSKKILDKYFEMVDYEACEYCFTTLYMWNDVYKSKYYVEKDFAVMAGEYDKDSFMILPLATGENIDKAMKFVFNQFVQANKKIHLKAVNKEIVEYLGEQYPDRFEYIEERDNFDYIYDGESLRTLAGRKNHKKRNHLNSFIKEFGERTEYKTLEKSDFHDCLNLIKEWEIRKDSDGDELYDDYEAVEKIFSNYDKLKESIKVGGIYIDSKLQAFSIGEMINKDMAVVHVEKANADIRGLYPYINQQFLVNEFNDAKLINREEDLGIEGLRKAKLSYHPVKLVEKYTVVEK